MLGTTLVWATHVTATHVTATQSPYSPTHWGIAVLFDKERPMTVHLPLSLLARLNTRSATSSEDRLATVQRAIGPAGSAISPTDSDRRAEPRLYP